MRMLFGLLVPVGHARGGKGGGHQSGSCAFLVPGEKTERERESGGEPHLTGNIQHRRVRYDDDDQPTTWHGGVGPMPRVCRHPLLAEAVVLMMSFLTLGDEYPYSFPIRALDAPTESSSDRLIQSFRLGFDQGRATPASVCDWCYIVIRY